MPMERPWIPNLRPRERGMSLLELVVVVGIMLTLSGLAVPSMLTVISSVRLSVGISNLSGLLQNCRMLAVKENKTKTTRFTVMGNGPVAYIKDATVVTSLGTGDVQVQLGAPLTRYVTPSGSGAPAELTSTELTFTAVTSDPSFNSRGFPCEYSAGVCTIKGFVFYFKDTRPMGQSGWSAVSVSPAGRIRRWTWSGSSWL